MKEQIFKLLTITLGLIASLSSAAEPSNPGTWRYGALGQTVSSQCNELYWSDPQAINATVLYSPNGSPRSNDYGIFIDASYETGSIYVQTPNCSGPVYKIGSSKEYLMLSLTNWSFTAYKITPTKNRVYGVGPEGSQVYESKIQVISRATFEDSQTPFYISTFEYWPDQKVVVMAGQYKSGFSSWNGFAIWKIGKPEIIQFDVDGTVSTLIDRRTKTIFGARVSTISGKKVFSLEAYSFEGNVVKQYKGISKFVNDFAAAHGGNPDSYVSISSVGSKVEVLAFGSTFTIDSANDRATFVPPVSEIENKPGESRPDIVPNQTNPKLGNAYRTPDGTIWGEVVNDGLRLKSMTWKEANAYCLSIGARLPGQTEIEALKKIACKQPRNVGGYLSCFGLEDVLPNLQTYFWTLYRDSGGYPQYYNGISGGFIDERDTRSEASHDVRCVM